MEKVFFMIDQMAGGGAERVITLLANGFSKQGVDTTIILTRQDRQDTVWHAVSEKVHILYLNELIEQPEYRLNKLQTSYAKVVGMVSRQMRKIAHLCGREFDFERISMFYSRNVRQVGVLRRLITGKESKVISFLNYSVFLSLFLVKNVDTLIISERNDPERYSENTMTMAFVKKMYAKASYMVCQSPGVAEWYKKHSVMNTVVIPNPLKSDLPIPYSGERRKEIVNFCRLDFQKNVPLLVEAFGLFYKEFPEYRLVIYGDEPDSSGGEYTKEILRTAEKCQCKEALELRAFQKHIHKKIIDSMMFVSSSIFEGMSNSMLEAMAIGLPTICTDCPAGGARYIIKNYENGILIPMNDAQAMCLAMKEVAESRELRERLVGHAVKLRGLLAEEQIVRRWRGLC